MNTPQELSEKKNGRKRLSKATTGDIILSVLLPGWGVLIGLIALCKGEKKRAVTMIAIGACVLALIISTESRVGGG